MSLTFTIQPFRNGVSSQEALDFEEKMRQVANYVYSLCGRYNAIAAGIVTTNSGQVIYNPTTGQILNGLLFPEFQITVGAVGSPLAAGDTTYTITDQRIIAGSLDIFADGVELPEDDSTTFSYSVLYSPTSIAITFNAPLQNNQILLFKYRKGGTVTGSVTKALQPTLYYTCVGGETSIDFQELVGVAITDIITITRATGVKQPVLGATSNMNQLQYIPANGRVVCPTGDVFYQDEVISIAYAI